MATRPLPPSPLPTTRTVRDERPSPTWADVSKAVAAGHNEVIVESEGLPAVAVISLAEYAALQQARKDERILAARHWIREFHESYDGRNDDLSEKEIEAIADSVVRDSLDSMAEKGAIRYTLDDER